MEQDEHLYCYRLMGGPMDGSEHLMTMDVMEMAVPVSSAEEGSWEIHNSGPHGSERPPKEVFGQEVGSDAVGYYHLYLWYGRVVDGSRVMEYHGYFSDDDFEDGE